MFFLKEDVFEVSPDKKVLKAKDYAYFLKSQEVVDMAHKRAKEITEEAKQAYEDEKKRGFEEGLMEGNEKTSELMIDAMEKSLANFEKFENDIIEVVIKAIRKILGDMDQKELISRVVRNALETVRSQKKINLIVSPSESQVVRDQLNDILAEFPSINTIDVSKDPRIQPGGCILETEMGVVDATIEVQLKAIKNSLMKTIK